MSAIPERVQALLTPEEREHLEELIGGVLRPTFRCPSCSAEVSVRLSVSFRGTSLVHDEKTPPQYILSRPPLEARALEAARAAGLMEAFAHATTTEKEHAGVPDDLDEFFLQFWKHAGPISVARHVLGEWIREFGGRIVALQYQGVIAVLSDDQLVAFVPKRLTITVRVPGGPAVATDGAREQWRKGRFGYVPASARVFGEALRQRNIGAFDSGQ